MATLCCIILFIFGFSLILDALDNRDSPYWTDHEDIIDEITLGMLLILLGLILK